MSSLPARPRLPLVPEDLDPGRRPSDALIRAIVAEARSAFAIDQPGAERIARSLWPEDRATLELLQRAATSPATTVTSGWASQLAATSVADILLQLGPASAGSELLRRGISLSFANSAVISVPTVTAAAAGVTFVEQGQPIPIRQLVLTGPTISPFKMAVAFTLTREVAEKSVPNAESLIRAVVTENLSAGLDSILLDANAATTVRPAGLRNGATSVSPTAGGGDAAMMRDLGALVAAVSGVGGLNVCFIMHPDEATKVILRASSEFLNRFPVLASNALADHTVMAVAMPALVFAADPTPRLSVARETVVVQDDAAVPAAVGTAGTPNVVGSPARSLWQTDCLGIRLIFEISFGLRTSAASAVATIAAATW